ncbi:preprotein translocase subunit YajC [uncultured Dialister sp.]|uniref:preprotein translocase subunit YajC n=1 Tax=uncultured Dialister sp. TaxID=278064 RepID=UPI0025EAF4D9|nr:preprotein translocase subunit YajC [uncultured Dialister sp.]
MEEKVLNFISLAWPFLILVAVMYFFMYRPTQKMKVERGRFLLSLKKGDEVVTAGGVHGVIKVLRDKYVELEIASKVIIKVEKTAIQHRAGEEMPGEGAEEPKNGKKTSRDDSKAKKSKDVKEAEPEVVEEIVEVDDPKDAGTEVVEEVVEVEDEAAKPEKADKKEDKK